MAGQPSLTKADVEFADLSDYAVSVHLLGASFRQDGALSHPRFCQERRHFSIFEEFPPPLLPVDSGRNLIATAAAFIPAAVMVMGTLVTVDPARAVETCHKINAQGEGQIDFATNSSEGQLLGGGLLHGTTHGEFAFTSFNPDAGIATYEGTFTITTEHGTLSLHLFDGVFNVGTGEFSNDSDVIDGTGRFEGAAGGLFFEGVVAPDGSFTDDVTGEVCLDLAP